MAPQSKPSPYRFEILGTDTDRRDALHGASLLSYMQEAAYHNAEHLGFGAASLDERGLCWLLLRLSVRLDQLPAWQDSLLVHTWSRGARRLLFLRDFRFQRAGDGAILGAASSEWLIGQVGTHRPQRPDTVFPVQVRTPDPGSALPFASPKLPALPADAPAVLQKIAGYSDIDRNDHVNNTRYAAWALDTHAALAPDALGTLCGIDINFLSEVRLGERVDLRALPVDAGQLEGLPDEALVADAAVTLVEGWRAADTAPVFRCLLQFRRQPDVR